MSASWRTVVHSGGGRALPGRAQLERLLPLPLVQLAVCGRSGSMLVQAFLDGCSEIMQVPHTFKFYDFAAACGGFAGMGGRDVAGAFVAHPAHAPLFDSDQSVLLGGRLGEEMEVRVHIDVDAFVGAMSSMLGHGAAGLREVLFAAVSALAWCRGHELDAVRTLLVHLHHGDWHWASRLVDAANVSARPLRDWVGALSPDRMLVTLRNPMDQIVSYRRFVPRAVEDPAARSGWYERYLRLLSQDWLRLDLYAAAGISLRTLRLEDLRQDKDATMGGLMAWMGLAHCPEAVAEPTIYGLPWWGDIYTAPSRTMNPPRSMRRPPACDPDAQLVYAAAPGVAASHGYPDLPLARPLFGLSSGPCWPRPSRSWPYAAAQWKSDRAERRAFLHSLAARHAESIAALRAGAAGVEPWR